MREAEWIVHDAMTKLKYDKRNEVVVDQGIIVDSGFAVTTERFRYQSFQYELTRHVVVGVDKKETTFQKGKLRKETRIDIPWRAIRNIIEKTDRVTTAGYIGHYVTFTYRTRNRFGEKGEERFTLGKFIPDINCKRDTVNNVVLALKVLSGKIAPRDTYAGYRHREGYYAEPAERVYREDRPASWDDPSFNRTIKEPNVESPRNTLPDGSGIVPEVRQPTVPEVRKPTVPEVRRPSLPEVRRPTVPETPNLRNSLPEPPSVRTPSTPSVQDTVRPLTQPVNSNADRLRELKSLYDRGLIGDDVYHERVNAIKGLAP